MQDLSLNTNYQHIATTHFPTQQQQYKFVPEKLLLLTDVMQKRSTKRVQVFKNERL